MKIAQASFDLVLRTRFHVSHGICLVALDVGRVGARCLPYNHPSRLYLEGRGRETRRKTHAALHDPHRD